MAGSQAGRQAGRQVGRQAGRQASRQAGKQARRQEGKKAGRQAGKQALGRHSVGAMPWRGLFCKGGDISGPFVLHYYLNVEDC